MVRPRNVAFPKEKIIELGEEMVQWVKQNNPLHLSQWYTIEKGFTYNEWKLIIQREEFFPYYEKALKLVGIQYLDKESRVNPSISQRWQRVYFKDLRDQEDADKEFEADLKKQENANITEEQSKALTQTVSMFDQILAHAKSQQAKSEKPQSHNG